MTEAAIVAGTVALLLVGLAGVVVPVLPGVLLVGGAATLGTVLLGVDTAGTWVLLATIATLTVVGVAASWVLPARRGVQGGASRSSLAVAAAGALVGFFAIPVVGLPVGAVIGLYGAERHRTGEHAQAWRATRQVVTGYGVGVLIELAISVLIVATWVGWVVVRLS